MRPFRTPLLTVLVVLVTGTFTWAEDRTTAPTRPLIAICGAYPPEMKALRQEFAVDGPTFARSSIKGVEFWRGPFKGKEILVFRTGVSVVNAAYQLQIAFDHFPITSVLFAGVAGGTDPSLSVGDIVIPEAWAYHDESVYVNEDGKGGYVLPDYYKPRHENFGMMFATTVSVAREGEAAFTPMEAFPADPALLRIARRVIPHLPEMKKGGRAVSLSVGGTGVTGSVFLDNAAYREWVFRVWKARCTDMESTALAQVAYANDKPFLIIRGLSDLAGGQHGKNPIDDNELAVSEIAARVLRAVVEAM